MTEIKNSKPYDLEERCLNFARRVNAYVNKLPKTTPNIENGKQLVRSAGSVGANYIEANEALSKKDFIMRVKISRKEIKEKERLINESTELLKIFSSILEKSK